jgi:hypothetical protein
MRSTSGGRRRIVTGMVPGDREVVFALYLIMAKVVSSNPFHLEVNSMQHYVIKFVSDLRQVDGFLWVLQFPLPIQLTATM